MKKVLIVIGGIVQEPIGSPGRCFLTPTDAELSFSCEISLWV